MQVVQGLQGQDLVADLDGRGLVRVGKEGDVFGAVEEAALGGHEVGGEEDLAAEGGEEGVEFRGGGWGEVWKGAWGQKMLVWVRREDGLGERVEGSSPCFRRVGVVLRFRGPEAGLSRRRRRQGRQQLVGFIIVGLIGFRYR